MDLLNGDAVVVYQFEEPNQVRQSGLGQNAETPELDGLQVPRVEPGNRNPFDQDLGLGIQGLNRVPGAVVEQLLEADGGLGHALYCRPHERPPGALVKGPVFGTR